MTPRTHESVSVGDALPAREVRVRRADLVRYAGASGDFNPIHWNERAAAEAGLPGVIAHGMLTMALTGTVLTAWAGDPRAIIEFTTRFLRPVVVPDDEAGASITLSGKVREKHDDGTVRVNVVATAGATTVGRASAVIRLAGRTPQP
ncbi:acyl dehydratase [Amycolatopsis lexingtonensis]|uniref:Acyl dehydratase n=1 Tax=Amycolatopsis lexingtonensis TaxID=218822 RepID=A0ABR9IF55_9PSEU|nr:MaoC family dehydratase [Amycolatopsis lexingtonensis]MBE1501811.1 acyl dehydratase [Amycolatopsis lexingtonensis]